MLWEAEKSSEILGKAVLSSIAKKVKVQSNPEGVPLWIEAIISNPEAEEITEKIQTIPTHIMLNIGYNVYLFLVDENYWDDDGKIAIPESGVTIPVAFDIGFGFGFEIGAKVSFRE